jgi:hypothetical protein
MKTKMTYIRTSLPPLEELKERLTDESWVNYYSKYDSFTGPIKSIVYLLDFFDKGD